MSKINWQIVDADTFAEFRFATADEIAQAFYTESMAHEPYEVRLNALHELGQGRFSEIYNNREARQRLFFNLVNAIYLNEIAIKAGA